MSNGEPRAISNRIVDIVSSIFSTSGTPHGAPDRRAAATEAPQDVVVTEEASPDLPVDGGANAKERGGVPDALADEAERLRIEARLGDMFGDLRARAAGSIQLVGLDRLRNRLGDRWDRRRDAVHSAATRLIREHVGPDDVFFRHGDTKYVIVFAERSEVSARLVAAFIRKQIEAAFIGMEAGDDLTIESVVTTVDGGMSVERSSLGGILERLVESLDASGASGLPGRMPGVPLVDAEDTAAALIRELQAIRDPGGKAASRPAAAPAPMPDMSDVGSLMRDIRSARTAARERREAAEAVLREVPSLVSAPIARPAGACLEAFAANLAHWQSALGEMLDRTPDEITLSFEPLLDVRQEVVSTSRCFLSATSLTGAELEGYSLLPDRRSPGATLLFDSTTLMAAATSIGRMIDDGRCALMAVPVHYETLRAPRTLSAILSLCHQIPPDLMRLIVVELVEMPDSIPPVRRAEVVAGVRHHFRMVTEHVPLAFRGFARLREGGVSVACTSLKPFRVGSTLHLSDNQRVQLRSFARGVHRHGMRAALSGVDNAEVAALAIEAGYDYLSGRWVGIKTPSPAPMRRFRLAEHLARTG